ncbi:MAG: DUF4105 domain-containing protein [Pseudomonadota bacterium]
MLILLWFPFAAFAEDIAYLDELIQRAREANLAQRAEWLNLLHYKPYAYWFGSRSLADDPEFFSAPNGRTDAAAELEATLAAFFSTAPETDKTQNPQCRFIARYHWLKQHLDFDPERLPPQPCKRFNEWRASLDPHEITLVFPAAYLNNPASMYGHTLLRIDAKGQDEQTRLLAYSISYAAGTDETSGLVFAVRGLFGGYPGVFSITPYYLKVREYSDIENRDVWEYRLTLAPEEIDRLLMHTWELGPTHFDYYFFDENCAYHLLSLLEVARPGLRLTDRFRWWAIPSDTVRAVTDQPDLLKDVVYRPASVTIMQERLQQLSPEERALARDLGKQQIGAGDGRLRRLPPLSQARVMELGYDYASYESATGRNKAPDAAAHRRELLLARSRLPVPPQKPEIPVPAVRPDQGHKTSRIGLGAGSRDGRRFGEIHLRPTYHDLLDQDAGYTRGAQIQFFDMRFRYYRNDELRVEEFKPLDIFSLSPRDDFFNPVSWKINVGWTRKRFPDGTDPLVFRLHGGPGLAYGAPKLFGNNAVYYGFLEVALDADSRYRSNYTLGTGPAIGLLTDITENWGVHLQARSLRYGLGDDHWARELALEQRYALGRQSALRLNLSRRQEFQDYWNSGHLSLYLYF